MPTRSKQLDIYVGLRKNGHMPTIAPANTTTISFTEAEVGALRSLLYSLRDEAKLREMDRAYSLGLGANHIETLTGLSDSLDKAAYDAAARR